MRTLTLTAAGIAASMFLAFSAQAATLTMTADKSTYNISETITLTIVGDSTGATAITVFGTIDTSGAAGLVTPGAQSQTALTSFGGFITWVTGFLQTNNPNPNTVDAFSQLGGLNPLPVDGLLSATVEFHADAAGIANFAWFLGTPSETLTFFGLTNAAGTSVTIVPEPTTAALLGIGLFGLAVAGRRR